MVCVVVVAIGAAGVVVWRSIPDYRIAFVVDTSAAGASSAVAGAVGAAVQNTGDGDALSLRRFGGRCGDSHNTAQVVGAGAGHAARISRSARGLATGGSATLESGVLAAINDFSGHYPFRGRKVNRIIVVTGRGTDACNRDQAGVKKALQAKVKAAGLRLDFRFVGYLTPTGEQANLTQLASAVNASAPEFARTPADLAATLKRLVIPKPVGAVPVKIPIGSFAGTWTVHGSQLVIRPDGTGDLTWNGGPCQDPNAVEDVSLCEGHSHVTFTPTGDGRLMGTYGAVSFTANDTGKPKPPPPGEWPSGGQTFYLRHYEKDHNLLVSSNGTGTRPGNPYFCDQYAENHNDSTYQLCGA